MFYKALLRNLSWLGPALNILLLKMLCQYSDMIILSLFCPSACNTCLLSTVTDKCLIPIYIHTYKGKTVTYF